MAAKRFASKIDWWLIAILMGSVILVVVGLGVSINQDPDPTHAAVAVSLTLLFLALIGSVLFRTYYQVNGNNLRIVSGPFHWNVPIDQIISVERTRNPLSSPALSLDRLRIRYADKKSIMISPADQRRFVKALGLELKD